MAVTNGPIQKPRSQSIAVPPHSRRRHHGCRIGEPDLFCGRLASEGARRM